MSDPGPFWLAIQAGDTAAVSRMIKKDRSLLDGRADSGHTPIRMACDCGQMKLAEALLELGAEMDAFDACAFGDTAGVLSQLDNKAELLTQMSHDGWTLLHLAGFFGRQELLSKLLERGADLSSISQNPSANTPLHAALAGAAGAETVGFLIDQGADVNALAGAGAMPLHLAASRGDKEMVDLLLARGATALPMDNGQTPADIARDRGFAELADRLTD